MENKNYQPPGYGGTPATYSQPNPPPSYNQPQPTITVQPTTVIVNSGVGPQPTQRVCPSCHATILTNVKYEATTKTHLVALLLCLFVCWPCVCLPYCMDSCQSANHYCPNCNAFLGSYAD